MTALALQQHQRILAVDDEAGTRELLHAHLTAAGYQVTAVASAVDALPRLAEAQTAILITDWLMPDLDGLELVRRVRANEAIGYLYVVVLTIQSQPQHLAAAFAAGADDFIAKPFSAEELLSRVRNGFRFLSMRHELASRTREAVQYASQLAALNQRLNRLARTDELTGLLNRREGLRLFTAHWESAVRDNAPLACIICDLDRFKTINDRHGHAVGDEALRVATQALRQAVRAVDVVARIGGEEFLIVCPQTTGDQAAELAERVRLRIAEAACPTPAGEIALSASFGVAELAQSGGARERLLSLADEAMYSAKTAGRNAVVRCAAPALAPVS